MTVEPAHMMLAAFLLASIGVWGILCRRSDPMRCLASVQLIFWGAALNFVTGASLFGDVSGTVFALFAVCVTAAQAATALTLFYLYYKKRSEVSRKDDAL